MSDAERPVRLIRPSERGTGAPTAGMAREEAFATAGLWSGLVRTEPGMTSGWHHHGEYESTIYVLTGRFRMEFGLGGSDVIDAVPGDFLYVARQAIHRESNPSSEEGSAIVVRSGTGDPVFNVEGPDG